MSQPLTIVAGGEEDIRWQRWKAKGAEIDRQSASRMRGVILLLAAGVAVWFAVQLA